MLGRLLAAAVLVGLAAVEFGEQLVRQQLSHSICLQCNRLQLQSFSRTAGNITIRLPFPPGVEYDYMQTPPPGSLPPKCGTINFNHSTALQQATYLFPDTIRGVETVAVREDGVLGLVDAYGKVGVNALPRLAHQLLLLSCTSCIRGCTPWGERLGRTVMPTGCLLLARRCSWQRLPKMAATSSPPRSRCCMSPLAGP
jgi:hypothetical protein